MLSIREAVACTKLTQDQIAAHFDVHKNTVNNWVNGHTDVGLREYQGILEYLAKHLDPDNLAIQIAAYLNKQHRLYVIADFRPETDSLRLKLITPEEIAREYVDGDIDIIADQFIDGGFGSVRYICQGAKVGMGDLDDELEIGPEGELWLYAPEVINNLYIGSPEQILARYPDLFTDVDAVENVLNSKVPHYQEQREAIDRYLRGEHFLLANQEFKYYARSVPAQD